MTASCGAAASWGDAANIIYSPTIC
jgi:hypothetical protein